MNATTPRRGPSLASKIARAVGLDPDDVLGLSIDCNGEQSTIRVNVAVSDQCERRLLRTMDGYELEPIELAETRRYKIVPVEE